MRFLLSKLRIFLFFPTPYLSQPLFLYSKNFDASEAKENEKNETNSNALK